MIAQIIIEHLKYGESVPRVWRLRLQQYVQIHGKQRPEDFSMLNHCIGKPREGLDTTHHIHTMRYRGNSLPKHIAVTVRNMIFTYTLS